MESLKKMLMGIAICLVGVAVSFGLAYLGWGISLFGLIITAAGYFAGDKDENE